MGADARETSRAYWARRRLERDFGPREARARAQAAKAAAEAARKTQWRVFGAGAVCLVTVLFAYFLAPRIRRLVAAQRAEHEAWARTQSHRR